MTAPEIDALLAGFRDWLMRTVAATDAATTPVTLLAPMAAEPPDLHSLLSHLIALRQEVNLQTRATRSQQEQSAESLRHLAEALQTLEQDRQDRLDLEDRSEAAEDAAAAERERAEQMERLRPLLKAMVDAHDALALARREVLRIQRIQEDAPLAPAAVHEEHTPVANQAAQAPLRVSWLARWLGRADAVTHAQQDALRRAREREAELLRQQDEERSAVRTLVDSIVSGYAMSLQRLERVLEQHGLEPIACLGEPFDPETMEVVEVVQDTNRSASEVVEEVRRGYLWQGRIFRFAQVKVARPGDNHGSHR